MAFPEDSVSSADTAKPRKKRSRGGDMKKAKTEHAPPSDAEAFKVRKIRLRLTKAQQRILKKWMGGARFVYNHCVAYIRAGNPANRSELRQRFAADGSPLMQAHPWLKDIPYKIREQASDDVVKANEANKAPVTAWGPLVGFARKASGSDFLRAGKGKGGSDIAAQQPAQAQRANQGDVSRV